MLCCTKMNGNGNDFFVVDNRQLAVDKDEFSRLARLLCRRRESLGADGILAVEPSASADFRMRLFNSDGSEGEMCGNGARCIARFALEKGIVSSPDMKMETLAGEVHAVVKGRVVTIDMSPVDISSPVVGASISAGGAVFQYTFLNVGVPHTVIFEKKHSRSFEGYAELGREIRNRLDLFPEGTNVNFAAADESGRRLDVMTYERGVEDMTLSCGTGSTASAIAANLLGIAGTRVEVQNPGGVNIVTLDLSKKGTVYPKLEGNTAMLADITFLPDALC
ncbi:MAG: diaminopimelate epimerase [Synergistes sp.]|nr:diaminopimelate epimerase [Synergistes sp.]MCR5335552.1 diaminopimelate epimerase [Synergistes sp.]